MKLCPKWASLLNKSVSVGQYNFFLIYWGRFGECFSLYVFGYHSVILLHTDIKDAVQKKFDIFECIRILHSKFKKPNWLCLFLWMLSTSCLSIFWSDEHVIIVSDRFQNSDLCPAPMVFEQDCVTSVVIAIVLFYWQ